MQRRLADSTPGTSPTPRSPGQNTGPDVLNSARLHSLRQPVMICATGILAVVTRPPLPGHDPLRCTDYPAGVEIGGLAPERRLIVRGICLDENGRLWLMYTWVPGLTEPMNGESGVALNVEYGA